MFGKLIPGVGGFFQVPVTTAPSSDTTIDTQDLDSLPSSDLNPWEIISDNPIMDLPQTDIFDSLPSPSDIVSEGADWISSKGTDAVNAITGLFSGDTSSFAGDLKAGFAGSTANAAIELSRDVQDGDSSKGKFVKLRSKLNPNDEVIFNVTPSITENRQAQYEAVAIVHHPGDILKYRTTSARSWSIEAKLISRNTEEATKNLKTLNIIRSWVMPYYGEGTNSGDLKQYLGAPPDILMFSAYGTEVIGEHPAVLESYNTTFPPEIDYVPAQTDNGPVPFPVVLNISLTIKEAWSPNEFSGFDLAKYKVGNLTSSFVIQTGKPMSEEQIREKINAMAPEPAYQDGYAEGGNQIMKSEDNYGNNVAASFNNTLA